MNSLVAQLVLAQDSNLTGGPLCLILSNEIFWGGFIQGHDCSVTGGEIGQIKNWWRQSWISTKTAGLNVCMKPPSCRIFSFFPAKSIFEVYLNN